MKISHTVHLPLDVPRKRHKKITEILMDPMKIWMRPPWRIHLTPHFLWETPLLHRPWNSISDPLPSGLRMHRVIEVSGWQGTCEAIQSALAWRDQVNLDYPWQMFVQPVVWNLQWLTFHNLLCKHLLEFNCSYCYLFFLTSSLNNPCCRLTPLVLILPSVALRRINLHPFTTALNIFEGCYQVPSQSSFLKTKYAPFY